jgi:hypothetical protein
LLAVTDSTGTDRLRGPDFFIVGAPKCGTTAMADYLSQHPEIGMCERKETHFFAGDEMWCRFGFAPGERPRGREEYMALFRGVQHRQRLGEASVWYLYSREAAREIHDYAPQAGIVVMLRNPLEMLPSLHSQFVFVGIEPEEDFRRALSLDDERERTGAPRRFPPHSYRSAARYSEQLTRYLDIFGPDQVHVVIYEDFRADTAGAFRGTCEFLGVDPTFVPDFRIVNPNKRVKSKALRRVVRTPPRRLRRVLHLASSQDLRRRVGRALIRWNATFGEREPTPDDLAAALRPLVEGEARRLRTLLGIDVGLWLDRSVESPF